MKFAPEYVHYVLNDNFEDAKALFLSPLMAIHYAHLVMLAETGIVSRDDAHRIREALDAVSLDEVRDVRFDGTCEDLFFYVERLLVDVVRRRGRRPAAHRPQPQRHRHDDVPDAPAGVRAGAGRRGARAAREPPRSRRRSTATRSRRRTRTRSRRSPRPIAHYLLAMIEQLERDITRLRAAYATTNRNPLGACAITGTGFPIDRSLTSELLGFDGPTGNTYGSIATVDYLLESTLRDGHRARRARDASCRTCCCGAPRK